MSRLSQENRFLTITDFSLGEDTFIVTSFSGSEYVSDLFEFEVELLSEKLNIKPEQIVGKSGTVGFKNEQQREFNGYVKKFSVGGIAEHDKRQYRITLVPWLWFLSKTNNHRIFQQKNTKEIVTQVFQDRGFNDFDFRAAGGKAREYCVQHNESDLNFVSRLLEEEGIAYYFVHEGNKHKMILVDQKNAYVDCAETNLTYHSGTMSVPHISAWEHVYQFKKGKWALADYNFKEPQKDIKPQQVSGSNFANNKKFEHYEYPGLYDFGLGSELVKIRLDAEESDRNKIEGRSDCSSLCAGGKFKLAEHPDAAEKGGYIIVAIYHHAVDPFHFAGGQGGSDYSNEFACIPEDVHFRPLPLHPKPVMPGPQSALVTGPSGEEIYIDDYGRIKVQFYWDREGKKDENTSCFLRVMQAWAGPQWGASFIPRIGHEVIVSFLDGDPDRPIVTGSVYNEKNKPVYPSKTQSGIKTRSTKGAGPANFNELRFEDKKGSEQIYVHAEKDYDTQVEHDQTLTVDNDRTKHIKHDENSTIDNDRNKTVGKNQTETIGENKEITVGGNHTENISKDKGISVGKNHTETVGGNMSIDITKDLTEKVGGKYAENVTKEYMLKADSILMDAAKEIVIQTGSAKIIMKKNGDIIIQGKNIQVKGSADVIVKGSKVAVN